MIIDPVGDLLTRFRNAAQAHKTEVVSPYSKIRAAVANVLKEEGYLISVDRQKNTLVMNLALKRRKPLITGIKNVSRPGLRIYRSAKLLPNTLGGAGISIISTSKGIMTNKKAKSMGLGGEVLGEVW